MGSALEENRIIIGKEEGGKVKVSDGALGAEVRHWFREVKGVWIVVRRKESDERKKERLKGLRRRGVEKGDCGEVDMEREVKVKRGFRKKIVSYVWKEGRGDK